MHSEGDIYEKISYAGKQALVINQGIYCIFE